MEAIESHNIQIVLIFTFGLALATIFGYITQKIKLSPIVGYLLAGYLIGPYSPGFVADKQITEQLAEIGVILMMFGVGLHFNWQDLSNVKRIAIPGAVIQTLVATVSCAFFVQHMGWALEAGIVLGLAIGVASTVVLIRVLTDNDLLDTQQGHISIGWLIVEDILTVVVLILIPPFAEAMKGGTFSAATMGMSIGTAAVKILLLGLLMFTLGGKFVRYALIKIAQTRSHELFTLAILSLTFVIATGSAALFGTSLALGAFIAGMVIGRSSVKHQALVQSLPMKDAFSAIFFLTVGMLFNPGAIAANPIIFFGVLAIILIIKPLAALLISLVLRYPLKVGLTVAVALAQIGEFSFILTEQAMKYDIFPDDGFDIIVACAIASIAINPYFFASLVHSKFYQNHTQARGNLKKESPRKDWTKPTALIVGFGPIGRNATHTLKQLGYHTIIIDKNIDTITMLNDENSEAIFGDAALPSILSAAHIETALLLVITNPEIDSALAIIQSAREMNERIQILARVRYQADRLALIGLGVDYVCCEEESSKTFRNALLRKARL